MAWLSFLTPSDAPPPDARTAPIAFLSREFARLAARLALAMAVIDVFSIGARTSPADRLGLIAVWSAMMAAVTFLVARRWPSKSRDRPVQR